MASEIHVTGPMSLKILSAIKQPVVVVAIVDLYRTGKSYLMNKLAGKKKGFSLGSTVQSHTKGIWMWCVPHPKKPGHILVLLDTEGLGDVEKNDSWIFALAILLSSTFVYNSMGTINQQNENEDSADFVSFFPDFVWTLRDFSLVLLAEGQPITADKYLTYSLKLNHDGRSPPTPFKTFNLPQLCIQKFFPKKRCFIFDRPVHRKKFAQLTKPRDEELDPEFVQQVADFYGPEGAAPHGNPPGAAGPAQGQ
uniref:GB1/RHD3-type G domain-containing protein n=1 Tax=Colobus angolensis palliatus TaxID=336983 RepID=A0A2K5KCB9_COLAP